jgi:hypothetical protein
VARTDGQTDGRTDGGDNHNIPTFFSKSVGIMKSAKALQRYGSRHKSASRTAGKQMQLWDCGNIGKAAPAPPPPPLSLPRTHARAVTGGGAGGGAGGRRRYGDGRRSRRGGW